MASLILPHAARDAYRELRRGRAAASFSFASSRVCFPSRWIRQSATGQTDSCSGSTGLLRVVARWSCNYCRNASSGSRRYSDPVFAETRTRSGSARSVILPISAEHRWLTQTGHGVQLTFPLTYPADEMHSYPVTPKVNKASFNESEAIFARAGDCQKMSCSHFTDHSSGSPA